MFHLLGQAFFGLCVGVIAKILMPGKDPGGLIVTALIGMAGSLLGTVFGRTVLGTPEYSAGWPASIIGSIGILLLYRLFAGRKKT
jgi:uncharacterized membrane protein YeaQ/YmgE (transglycosylase-associated protein family)